MHVTISTPGYKKKKKQSEGKSMNSTFTQSTNPEKLKEHWSLHADTFLVDGYNIFK